MHIENLITLNQSNSNWLQVETVFDHFDTDADTVLPPK